MDTFPGQKKKHRINPIYKQINRLPKVNGIYYRNLRWENSKFNYPNMVSIETIGDGSCLFHSILMSFFKPYQFNQVDRKKYAREFRRNLASELRKYYDKISEGQLYELSKSFPKLKLENMQKELDSSKSVDQIYNEFISDIVNIDIYLLNAKNKDVNMVGTRNIYKNRVSVVILFTPGTGEIGHYELIGVMESERKLKLSFEPSHPIIKTIQQRMREKVENTT